MSTSDPFRLVAISGNLQRPSRSRALAELIARRVQQQAPLSIEQYDVIDANPGLGAALSRAQLTPQALRVVKAIEQADALVVSTPVYKGSYPGLFKHLIDFVDMQALTGIPIILAATGGGQRHALMVEHQLRPLFGFFSALTLPTAIYADDKSFENYQQQDPGILARVELAAGQLAGVLAKRMPHHQPETQDVAGASNVVSLKG